MTDSPNLITWEPLRLTHSKPSIGSQEAILAARQDLWHKFIVFDGGKYDASEVLKAVINACETEVLLPVMYKVDAEHKATFLIKCNSAGIDTLVKQNLMLTLPGGHNLCMDIVLGFLGVQDLQLYPNRVIAQALDYRSEPVKKILNLDDFENEKSLGAIFCPISVPKVLQFVLRCCKMGVLGKNREARLSVRELSLRHNKITAIVLFEKFFNYHLTKLDFSHNDITDVEYLRYFSEFKISEIWLDGNPLCDKYASSHEYIQAVKNVFPHLQKLDGVVIGMEQKIVLNIRTNFLGDGGKVRLIKQFVKHFFTLYDQPDRIVMNGLYDRDALYSMTLGPLTNPVHKQMAKTFVLNRNLLKFVDYAKSQELLLHGPEKIISALRRQPPTMHNFKTFHIDLLHEGEKHLALSVQGLFVYKNTSCPPMLFNRTFIITKKEDCEYCITNDQYYLDGSPANNAIAKNSEVKFETRTTPKFVPTVFSISEKEQLLMLLHELTTMNTKSCRKYLDDAEWNIRSAITTFMKRYTVNDVPPDAFQ
ncbi:hypothetical protein KM043_001377 [Ampulex compressa]|nr:hypothetical protein KM043_001377 [Ampulex compressa]